MKRAQRNNDARSGAADEPAGDVGGIGSIPGLRALWSETTGDPRVVVAVLDGPVDRAHPALVGARLETIEAAVPAPARIGGPATGHGTAVASLIFGRHVRENPVWGVAPACRGVVVPIFSDAGTADEPFRPVSSQLDLARAVLLALEHGAGIINISAGQPVPASSAEPILAAAVERALRRGILVVAAAGNDGCDCAQIPAALPGVLAVGALDSRGRPLLSSNWGGVYRSAGLLAPGGGLIAARAAGGTSRVGGTSYATAIVAGAAALLQSLALGRGRFLDGPRIRRILLDSAQKCLDDSISCRRWLAGRLDLVRSRLWILGGDFRMSDEFPMPPASSAAAWPGLAAAPAGPPEDTAPLIPTTGWAPSTPSATAAVRSSAPIPYLVPSEGCGCASCRGQAETQSRSGQTGLVFALGRIGYDVISEARRDSIQQHMGGPAPNPLDPAQMLAYLKDHPWESASILWTLESDQTRLYAIAPGGPFAGTVYQWLREFLAEQLSGQVELVSIPGRLAGQARLFNGQILPVVIPEPRGLYSWSTGGLVEAVVGAPPPADAAADRPTAHARKAQAVREFLQKVYHELRNLGLTAEDRAVNYAATNAFQVEKIFESAIKESLALDSIEVERSPLCRPDSDCWDVKVCFF
jgi:cyanobactin maturation PatA/PatG family protease